jgi:acyl-CoA thioester hydrolase
MHLLPLTSDRHHHCELFRVYYEDTDACAIVYHANYLRYAERARTELLRFVGIERARLEREQELAFVVRHMSIDYKIAARLDDMLQVRSAVKRIAGSSLTLLQQIWRDEQLLVAMEVVIVAVHLGQMKPLRIPAWCRECLAPYLLPLHPEYTGSI